MADFSLAESLRQLESWSQGLANEVKSATPQVRDAIKPGSPLPKGCPSHAAMADLILNGVRGKLVEVQAALRATEAAIWRENPDK